MSVLDTAMLDTLARQIPPEEMREVLHAFRTDLAALGKRVASAESAAECHAAAHALAGAAANCGAGDLAEAARALMAADAAELRAACAAALAAALGALDRRIAGA